MANNKDLHDIIKNKPYLAWDIKDVGGLSTESVVEHILNYGDWDDFLKVEEVLGVNDVSEVFNKLKNRKRLNLRLPTINYFENYFAKYAR